MVFGVQLADSTVKSNSHILIKLQVAKRGTGTKKLILI